MSSDPPNRSRFALTNLESAILLILGVAAAIAAITEARFRNIFFAALALILVWLSLRVAYQRLTQERRTAIVEAERIEAERIEAERIEAERLKLENDLLAHLNQERQSLEASLPFGSVRGTARLTLGTYAEESALLLRPNVEPPYENDNLIERLCDDIEAGAKLLVTGEAGQGKSLLLQLVQDRLVRRFQHASPTARATAKVPVFVPMSAIRQEPPEGALLKHLAEAIRPEGFLSQEQVVAAASSGRLVVLLDGADEIPAGMRDADGNVRPWLLAAMDLAQVVSTRPAFLHTFLQGHLADRERVSLKPLAYGSDTRRYLRAFATEVGQDPAPLIATFEDTANDRLRDLCATPLVLFMAADVIVGSSGEGATPSPSESESRGTWSSATVYRRYTEKWLEAELRKGANLHSLTQQTRVVDTLAWLMFRSSATRDRAYGVIDFGELVVHDDKLAEAGNAVIRRYHLVSTWPDVPAIVDDLRHRTFLVVDGGEDAYRLAHKSFYEFLVADYLFAGLKERPNKTMPFAIAEALRVVLPDPMIGFLREMLEDLKPGLLSQACATNLRQVAQLGARPVDLSVRDDEPLIDAMVRQQAANLLPLVLRDDELESFELEVRADSSPLVWRGAAVGLALHKRRGGLLNDFVLRMRTEPDTSLMHIAYNRLYYGDISLDEAATGEPVAACRALFDASVRHLGNEHYRHIWPMDIYTLEELIRSGTYDVEDVLSSNVHRLHDLLLHDVAAIPGAQALQRLIESKVRLTP